MRGSSLSWTSEVKDVWIIHLDGTITD